MKFILILIIIIFTMLISLDIVRQIKDRYYFYEKLDMFLKDLKLNVSFNQLKLDDFIKSVNAGSQFRLFLDDFREYLSTGKLDLSNLKYLEDDDKNSLFNVVNNLGKFDADNEIKNIDDLILQLQIKKEKSKQDKEKLAPMIIKLSLLFALALSIILI